MLSSPEETQRAVRLLCDLDYLREERQEDRGEAEAALFDQSESEVA